MRKWMMLFLPVQSRDQSLIRRHWEKESGQHFQMRKLLEGVYHRQGKLHNGLPKERDESSKIGVTAKGRADKVAEHKQGKHHIIPSGKRGFKSQLSS